jgi:hypothetical protein
MSKEAAGQGYLEHLTDEDLRVLAGKDAAALRRRPAAIVDLFDRPDLFDQVYGQGAAGLVRVSPFFAFLVAVDQAAREFAATRYVAERAAPRQVVPVFDTPRLREFLTDPLHRLFLAELLASFVRVASGRYWTRTTRGWRSQRYSELDPVRLAQLVSQAPSANQPGLYRRLGDVALFLTGVFPDYAQLHALGPFDAARLLRTLGLPQDRSASPPLELLEYLGQRWYRQAASLAPVVTLQLSVVAQVADRFRDARRILNHIADRYFVRVGNPWFGQPGS